MKKKKQKKKAEEDSRPAADAGAAAGGMGAEVGAGEKAKTKGIKRAINSTAEANKKAKEDKAKEDKSNTCNNCQEKYVETAKQWVVCSFCVRGIAMIVEGV